MKPFFVLAGGLTGALALSVLTLFFHLLFFRPALKDGQYMFVFFVTVPVGIMLGALTGLLLAYLSDGQTETVGRFALLGGSFLTMLFLFLGLFVFSGTENLPLWERFTATLFWFGLPLLWSGILIREGLRLLADR